jgi:hypothetical protein
MFYAVYRILLRLGPQPFATDVGTDGGQDIHLDLDEEDEAKDERDKQGHDQVDPADGGNARCRSCWLSIRYFSHDVSTAVRTARESYGKIRLPVYYYIGIYSFLLKPV